MAVNDGALGLVLHSDVALGTASPCRIGHRAEDRSVDRLRFCLRNEKERACKQGAHNYTHTRFAHGDLLKARLLFFNDPNGSSAPADHTS